MEIHAHVPKVGKTSAHWLLEGLFIVISVALGFGVSAYREQRADRDLELRVIQSLRTEIEHNVEALEPFVPVHAKWVDTIGTLTTISSGWSGFDVFLTTRPPLPPGAVSPFPFLRRSAWDAAVSSNTLRLIDYDLASSLSDVYRLQDIASGNVERRLAEGVMLSPSLFDPAARVASTRLLSLTLADIASSEAILLDLYKKELPILRAAASAR